MSEQVEELKPNSHWYSRVDICAVYGEIVCIKLRSRIECWMSL